MPADFAGGYLAAAMLDPLKPERIDHIVIALICIALTASLDRLVRGHRAGAVQIGRERQR